MKTQLPLMLSTVSTLVILPLDLNMDTFGSPSATTSYQNDKNKILKIDKLNDIKIKIVAL